jgi:glycosyltransferase involved in cell wall biosynthesis
MVLGVRGISNIQGGIETHAEHLYTRLARMGSEVVLLVRSPFVPPGQLSVGAVTLRRIWSPRSSGLEAFVHSLLGVCYAIVKRPDILHIHAVGPAIVTPIARLFGLKVVVTHHGADYEREKWGAVASWLLRLGEWLGMRLANARIAVSNVIAEHIRTRYRCTVETIPNGMPVSAPVSGTAYIDRLGVQSRRYFLQVSRMVPEKRQLDVIQAFSSARVQGWKLVLAGKLQNDHYSERVRVAAAKAGVVLTDFVTGEPLRELYANAGVFVLGSSHEGLPIVVLEALSHGLPVLASDIAANLEIGLDPPSYFPLGDITALAAALERIATTRSADAWPGVAPALSRKYDWDAIAERTHRVYDEVLTKARSEPAGRGQPHEFRGRRRRLI